MIRVLKHGLVWVHQYTRLLFQTLAVRSGLRCLVVQDPMAQGNRFDVEIRTGADEDVVVQGYLVASVPQIPLHLRSGPPTSLASIHVLLPLVINLLRRTIEKISFFSQASTLLLLRTQI